MRFLVLRFYKISAHFLLTFISLLLFISSSTWANEWLWQADNHATEWRAGIGQWEASKFTDGVSEFRISGHGSGGWYWDDPFPGTVTFRQTNGWMAGNVASRGFANSSDFGEAFDIDKGITVAARVWPIHAYSHGTLCLSAANTSTQDLPGKSAYVWVGWAVPGEVRFYNTNGKCLRKFKASVDYDNRWSIWTFSAKQIGDTVAWDLWIDKEHQGADQAAPDGTKHTLIYTEKSESGNSVRFGQRQPMSYPHETAWDYVAVTNEGVIPGWNGNAAPAKEPEQPMPITEQRKKEMLRLAVFKEYMKAEELTKGNQYAEVIDLCDKALEKYKEADPSVKKSLWFQQINALTQTGKPERAVQLCDEILLKYPDRIDPHHLAEFRSFKVAACEKCGRIDEAVRVIDNMLLTLDEAIAAANGGAVIANPGYEEVAKGNEAPGWGWYCTAAASFRSETSNPHSGSRCLVFTNASELAPEVYGRLNQVLNVFPATKYEISLRVKGEDVSPGNHLADWGGYMLEIPGGTFDWKKITTTFATKDDQTSLNLGINVTNKCKALYIDDITVRPVEPPSQVKSLYEQKAALMLKKANLYFQSKRYRDALTAYNDVKGFKDASDESKAMAIYHSGICYREIGYHRSAEQCMELVMKRYPESIWTRNARGQLYLWGVLQQSEQPAENTDTPE